MHQFKDKIAKLGSKADAFASPLGLLSYPVLMTADIMMYNATRIILCVFSRQMCPWEKIRFNMWRWLAISSTTSIENTTFISIYQNLKCLWVELAVGCEIGRRIMSLSDGKKKMSKSSQTQFSNISIIGVMQCKSVKHRLSRTNSRVH